MDVSKPVCMIVGRACPILTWRELESTSYIMNIAPSYLIGFTPFKMATRIYHIECLYLIVFGIIVSLSVVVFCEEAGFPRRLPCMPEHPVASPSTKFRVGNFSSFVHDLRSVIKTVWQFSDPANSIRLEIEVTWLFVFSLY